MAAARGQPGRWMARSAEVVDRRRRQLLQAGVALGACAAPLARAAGDRPVLRTNGGRVRGFVDGDLQVFRGIRYGVRAAIPGARSAAALA